MIMTIQDRWKIDEDLDIRLKTNNLYQTKVFCPTGPGGGVDPTCPKGTGGVISGGASSVFQGQKDADGNWTPGTVGKTAGVDTNKWKKQSAFSQKMLGKLAVMEQAALKGDWGAMQKSFITYSGKDSNALRAMIKSQMIQAQENLLKFKEAQLTSLPVGAKPLSGTPLVAKQEGWQKIGPQLGSQPGGKYKLGDQEFYVKTPNDPARAHNEVLALKLYQAAGAKTVNGHIVEIDGKKSVATEWENSDGVDWNSAASKKVAAEDFAAHAWLANWDAIGAPSDMNNIRLMKDGKQKIVDAGGSLDHRAQEASGKKPFTSDAPEWNTLRDPKIAPAASQVFGDMTPGQLIASAEKLKSITNNQVAELVEKYHGGSSAEKTKMTVTLIERRDKILANAESLKAGQVSQTDQTSGSTMAIPKPSTIGQSLIYDLAKEGKINEIESISTNVASKLDYKNQVLAALKSGGKASPNTGGKEPPPSPPKPTVNPSLFPQEPTFASSQWANVQQNQIVMAQAKKLAESGNLDELKALTLPPSNKLKTWYNELVSNVAKQLLPPQPKTDPSVDFKTMASSVVKKNGHEKIGYWTVVGESKQVKEIVHKNKPTEAQKEELWSKGKSKLDNMPLSDLKKVVGYTSSSSSTNLSLRGGKPTEMANILVKTIKKHAIDLPEGMTITRTHPVDNKKAFDNLKPGLVVADKAILSTSTTTVFGGNDAHWIMTVGPGVKGLPVKSHSEHPHEEEILLPPNQKIMVTKVEKESGGSKKVYAYILPSDMEITN